MKNNIDRLLNVLKKKEYKSQRYDNAIPQIDETIPEPECSVEYLCKFLKNEKPVIYDCDIIGFNRYQKNTWDKKTAHGNFVPDYAMFLKYGFYGMYEYIKSKKSSADSEQSKFICNALKALEAILELMKKYRSVAEGTLKAALDNLLKGAPKTYHEAAITLKLIQYILHIMPINHVTFGRFDQYMYPFYKSDIEKGVTREELLYITKAFFVNINFDTDMYFGRQQGDNGQSMVLGGYDENGNDEFNDLSDLCMEASLSLSLIDPKINLRVSKKTPFERYVQGTYMTKEGLGFPQYCNDDVVVPGLIRLGHSPKEAHNYCVAACWEYIMPNRLDITNYASMVFPKMVDSAVHEHLTQCKTFDEFMDYVKENIDARARALHDMVKDHVFVPNTVYSLFFAPCVEKLCDYSECNAPCNFGFHGTGIANGADALAAIKKLVFDEKGIEAQALVDALNADFKGYETLRSKLLACPKMGNNDDYVDDIASKLMETYCICMDKRTLPSGGKLRPGTGSALGYISTGKSTAATADGRYAGTPFSSSFSPSITAHTSGLLSVIQSFTKYDMSRIINGGPLTIEIHDTVFRNDYGIEKVAKLVEAFVALGGQQLQLNSINRDRLIEAQAHPELHPDLIVRVWGWSGYFNELDVEFQNHIISRTEYTV